MHRGSRRSPASFALLTVIACAPAAAQSLAATASAASPLQLRANLSPGTVVAAGTALPNGYTATDTGPASSTASIHIGLVLNAAPPRVTYTVDDQFTLGFNPGGPAPGVILRASTGPHDTVLQVTASQPAAVAIKITWTHLLRGSGLGATVDVGDDGSTDWLGFWSLDAPPATLLANIGAAPLRIRTHTSSAGEQDSYSSYTTGPGPSSLQIEVTLRSVSLQVVAGALQSAPSGEAFAQPVVFALTDLLGAPITGAPVAISVQGPATTSLGATVLTDAQGRVTVPLLAQLSSLSTTQMGLVAVAAATTGLAEPVRALLFVDTMQAFAQPGIAGIFVGNPGPLVGDVPYVVLASPLGIPPLQTPFGPIATNPLDPSTILVEDSIGVFGFFSLGGFGAIGRPSFVNFYNLPPGFLTGVTVQVQAVGIDPLRGVVRTNPAPLLFL
jgi:hypothetical protein